MTVLVFLGYLLSFIGIIALIIDNDILLQYINKILLFYVAMSLFIALISVF
jgi:hypothetical protein